VAAVLHRHSWPAVLLFAAVAGCAGGPHGVPASMLDWNRPFQPFRVAGNVHYVGTNVMALFLLTTPAGHILIDSGFEKNVPRLRQNVEALGFRFADIKVLLSSHAHIDHVQGHALVRQLTGARVVASAGDAPTITSGGKDEWAYGDDFSWPPCPVDQIVGDGEAIELGGTTLTARLTPGHTRGAVTWTTTVKEAGRNLDVVFYASGTIPPGVKVVDNPAYPEAVAAYQRSFATWKALPCDVFLGSHGEFFDLAKKFQKWKDGDRLAFVDPQGYRRTIAEAERQFRAAVDRAR
jgi:metallo-beta-lactamase class B